MRSDLLDIYDVLVSEIRKVTGVDDLSVKPDSAFVSDLGIDGGDFNDLMEKVVARVPSIRSADLWATGHLGSAKTVLDACDELHRFRVHRP